MPFSRATSVRKMNQTKPATADTGPSRRKNWILPIAVILMFGLLFGVSTALAASANLDQCANGAFDTDPPDPTPCRDTDWQNGSLNQQHAHYLEGDSVPYRAVLTDLTVGETYTLTIEWDATVSSGKHALDYLTSFNRTEPTADPCLDINADKGLDCSDIDSMPIPPDPNVQAGPDGIPATPDDIVQVSGDFTIYGGTITGLSGYTLVGDFTGASMTSITVTFTADDSSNTVVLAWGGHISRRLDWGEENSAVSISGSSYHMRLADFTCSNEDCSTGQQDRSLSNQAVIFPGIITIVKEMSPAMDPAPTFNFDITGPNDFQQNFSLNGNGGSTTLEALLDFGTYDVTELLPDGTIYEVKNITCVDPTGGTSTDPNLQTASIGLAEADIVTCTFTNKVISQPSITLTKLADPTTMFEPGGPVTYTVEVLNTGNVPVTLTSLADVVGAAETDLLGEPGCNPKPTGPISVGESYSCTFQMTVEGIGGYEETDTVTAVVVDEEGNESSAENSATVVLIPFNPSIQVVKTGSPSSGAVVGETITYDYTVTNTGDVTLINVSLDDDKLGGITLSDDAGDGIDVLAPGDSESGQATHQVTQADIDAGSLTNVATALGIDPKGGEVSGTDDETVTFAQEAALEVVKTAEPAVSAIVGERIVYTYVVTNTGSVTLTNVTLDDDIEGPIALDRTTLAPGESASGSATHIVTQDEFDAGSLTNTATATGTDPNNNEVSATDQATVRFVHTPAIDVVKTASHIDGVNIDDAITYTYVVTNTGNVTLTNVTLDDDIEGPIALDRTTLAPGESTTGTATHIASQLNVDTGSLRNVATATGTPPAGPPVSDTDDAVVTFLQAPAIDLDKSVSDDNGGDVSLGDKLTYSFQVTNTGNLTLHTVSVVDPMPGLSAITCPKTTLAPGESMPCTATYTVTQADVDAGQVDNTATASGTASNGSKVSDEDSASIPVAQHPGIAIEKMPKYQEVEVGQLVRFVITVTNDGNTTDTNVAVTDAESPDCNREIGNLAPGESVTYNCTDLVEADFTNVAVVMAYYPNGESGSDEDSAEVNALIADLVLKKQAPKGIDRRVENVVDYTIIISNQGDLTAKDVSLSDVLPAELLAGSVTSSLDGDVPLCGYEGATHTVSCLNLGDIAPGESVSITIITTIPDHLLFGQLDNEACTDTDTPEITKANNCDGAKTWYANGPTRTIGYYRTHPGAAEACINANTVRTKIDGVAVDVPGINMGFMQLRDERWDNDIDDVINLRVDGTSGDQDSDIETALEMTMGYLNANIVRYLDGSRRGRRWKWTVKFGRQYIAAYCNETLLGTDSGLPLDYYLRILEARDWRAMREEMSKLNAFNNSGHGLSMPPGWKFKVDRKTVWDDPMDWRD